jgi:hypothetical protein
LPIGLLALLGVCLIGVGLVTIRRGRAPRPAEATSDDPGGE